MARRSNKHVDYPFLIITAILLLAGLFILSSASFSLSSAKFNTPYFYLSRQISGVLIGVAVLYFLSKRPKYTFWKKIAVPLFILNMALLIVIFIPNFGTSYSKGATRWITLGSISFQPAEFVKIAFIIYLAAWLDSKRSKIKNFWYGLLPFMALIGIIGILLVSQPDISTFLILMSASILMFFIAGGRFVHIAYAVLIGAVVMSSFFYITSYNVDRILVFLRPGSDPQGSGYHLNQSLIAIGSGGILGKGFGLSDQKFKNLPEPIGDSIFAIFSEEQGYVGNIVLLGLYVLFFWRGIIIAIRAPDNFGKLLALGIVLIIFIQTMVNMGAFTGLLPLTGTPLPFISYGRSAVVALLAEIGILLNISKYMV